MRTLSISALALGLLVAGALTTLEAQRQRVSPRETVSATIGGKKVTIEYSRPYVKGREVWDANGSLAPFGKVWRTGADEATTITTEGDLMLGSLHVPAGTYALFTIPGESEWTLIVNKTAKQWGAFKYDANEDLGRVKMKAAKQDASTEQFTIELSAAGGSNGVLKMTWEKLSASIPVMMH
jgi:hypothetical protein